MLAWLRVKSRMSAKARVVALDDKKFVIGHLHSRRPPTILRLWRDFTSPANGRCWPGSDLRPTVTDRPQRTSPARNGVLATERSIYGRSMHRRMI